MVLKGGGKLFVTPQGNLITRIQSKVVFLGTLNQDLLAAEFEKELEKTKDQGKLKKINFDDLFSN